MILALDTNVLIHLWNGTVQGQKNAMTLDSSVKNGDALVICGAVYIELHAHVGMTHITLTAALSGLGIAVDHVTTLPIWQEAGRANAAAATRRRRSGNVQPRRPLADHLIGAHAQHRADVLLTANVRDFSDFPALKVFAT